MKKLLLIATCSAALSAYALPTYEPFTEFSPTIQSSGTTMVVKTNGVSLGAAANSSIPNCLDLATGGYQAPSTEPWGALLFSGTMPSTGTKGVNITNGLDIAVISNSTVFTYSALSSLLPSSFPGFPPSGGYITNMVENPAQPFIYNGAGYFVTNIVGNSAVLKFAQDITRPTSGTKTLFVSYLFNLAQQGQLGGGNNGRYLASSRMLRILLIISGHVIPPLAKTGHRVPSPDRMALPFLSWALMCLIQEPTRTQILCGSILPPAALAGQHRPRAETRY